MFDGFCKKIATLVAKSNSTCGLSAQGFEPLLAPKQHRAVYAAVAQAQQRTRASRCGVRTILCG